MPLFKQETLGRFTIAPTDAQRAAVAADIRRVEDWRLADQRWLRDVMPARSYFTALERSEGGWTLLSDETARQAFMPIPDLPEARPARVRGTPPNLSPKELETACRRALRQIGNKANADRDFALPRFREDLDLRLEIVDVEGEDLVAAREAVVDRLRDERSGVQDWAREGRIAAARRSVELARAMVALRRKWLEGMPFLLAAMEPTPLGSLIVRAAPFVDEV